VLVLLDDFSLLAFAASIDALRIANDGRRQRVEAEKQLITCEIELKQALRAAQARSTQQPG
jgi:transcriptional regulator GlxA family with amidase domain